MLARLEGRGNIFDWETSGYSKPLVEAFKTAIPYQDRKWRNRYDSDSHFGNGHWEVAATHWLAVMDLSEANGCELMVEGAVNQDTGPGNHTFQLDYMGLVYHRVNTGAYTSSGWVNGDWNASFTLDVLQEWFRFDTGPGQMPTLYGVLGVDPTLEGLAFDKALKRAYRVAARTWHPDINKEPEAEENFKKIQIAYEKLGDSQFRAKYQVGLQLQRSISKDSAIKGDGAIKWFPPVRCGMVTVHGTQIGDRYSIEKILKWRDITNAMGETMIAYWPKGAETFATEWEE